MAKETLSPQKEAVKAQTLKVLSKYNSKQLLDKLNGGTLMGMSKEAALEILEKRKIEIPKAQIEQSVTPHGSSWSKDPKKFGGTPALPAPPVQKKEKEMKAPKESKTKRTSIELIDETLPAVQKILTQDGTKTAKIKGLLGLGYSPLQISKCSVNAIYAFIYTVKQNLNKKD